MIRLLKVYNMSLFILNMVLLKEGKKFAPNQGVSSDGHYKVG